MKSQAFAAPWRWMVASAAAVALSAVVAGQSSPVQQRPVFRSGTNMVLVDAYPRRDGRIVPGLTADDFEVFEDGKPQKIEQFDFLRAGPVGTDREPAPEAQAMGLATDPRSRVFVAYLDIDHVTKTGARNMQSPLVDLLDRVMGTRDLFGVATSRSPTAIRFGRSMLPLIDLLGAEGSWGLRDGKTPDPNSPIERHLASCGYPDGVLTMMISRLRQDQTLSGLEELVNFVSHLRETRTFVLVVTEGWNLGPAPQNILNSLATAKAKNVPIVGPRGNPLRPVDPGLAARRACDDEALSVTAMDLEARFQSLMERAQRDNVTFYPINPAGMGLGWIPERSGLAPVGYEPLLVLAQNTDGEALIRPEHFKKGIANVGQDISAYYLLGYVSANPQPAGRSHVIRVRVKQPGVSVSARRGYTTPTVAEVAATELLNKPPPDVSLDITEALGRLAGAASGKPLLADAVQWGSGGEVLVLVELSPEQLAKPGWTRGADVRVTVTGETGSSPDQGSGRIEPGARSALLVVKPTSDSGLWRIAIRAIGENGELAERLVIQEPHGALLDSPLISRSGSAASAVASPAVSATFRRTERLRVEWPIVTTITSRSARLLDTAGRAVPFDVTLTEERRLGRPTLVASLLLAPLQAGDYVIEVTVGDGKETEQRFVAARIVR